MSENKIIILAILIVGVSFFYANLGGVTTGEYKNRILYDSGIEIAGQKFYGGGEVHCVVGQITCNNGGGEMGKLISKYGDVVRCVETSQGGSNWEIVKSCDKANPCVVTSTGATCRYALTKGLA